MLPELPLQALDLLPARRFDAIIADEGQDFETVWWTALDACLASDGPHLLRIFYDSNQRVSAGPDPPYAEICATPSAFMPQPAGTTPDTRSRPSARPGSTLSGWPRVAKGNPRQSWSAG